MFAWLSVELIWISSRSLGVILRRRLKPSDWRKRNHWLTGQGGKKVDFCCVFLPEERGCDWSARTSVGCRWRQIRSLSPGRRRIKGDHLHRQLARLMSSVLSERRGAVSVGLWRYIYITAPTFNNSSQIHTVVIKMFICDTTKSLIKQMSTCSGQWFRSESETHLFPVQRGAHRHVAGARVDAELLLRITAHNRVDEQVIWRPIKVDGSYLRQMHS